MAFRPAARIAVWAGLALLIATPSAATGEDAVTGALKDGDRVRVEAPPLAPKRAVGEVLGSGDDRLRLRLEDGRELDLARADIGRLEVSRGSRPRVAGEAVRLSIAF